MPIATLAKSAAPEKISAYATIKILTESGYQLAKEGDDGFVCIVMRGWSAQTFTPAQFRQLVYDPTVRAPICFDPVADRSFVIRNISLMVCRISTIVNNR